MNDADHITSPAKSRETVGNSPKSAQRVRSMQILEKDDTFALDAMWDAYQRYTSQSVEKSYKPLTNPQISLYGSYYGTLMLFVESGEGVVSSGDVVQTLDYYPFGSERINQDYGSQSQRTYIGEHYDDETDLSYLNARYYKGDRGQFLSQDPVFWEDPLSQNLENPQSLNSYSYAENNPIIKKDPTGRCPMCLLAVGGAGAGIVGQFGYDVYNNVQSGGWGNAFSNFSASDVYLTRAFQGAIVGATGGAAGGLSIGSQAAIVGLASGATGAAGNAYLGQQVTAQSILTDTLIGGLTFGAGRYVNAVPGRWPNFGTSAFFTGKHTQQSAMQLGVGSISNYTSQLVGGFNFSNTNMSGGSSASQSAAKALGIGNTGGGGFVGTYNFGSGIGTYDFGADKWVTSAQSTPAVK